MNEQTYPDKCYCFAHVEKYRHKFLDLFHRVKEPADSAHPKEAFLAPKLGLDFLDLMIDGFPIRTADFFLLILGKLTSELV